RASAHRTPRRRSRGRRAGSTALRDAEFWCEALRFFPRSSWSGREGYSGAGRTLRLAVAVHHVVRERDQAVAFGRTREGAEHVLLGALGIRHRAFEGGLNRAFATKHVLERPPGLLV